MSLPAARCQVEAKRKRQTPTFSKAAERVHWRQIAVATKNAKHRDQWITTLERRAMHLIGEWSADDIASADILQVLSPIWVAKPETARRVKQRLQTVFSWVRQAGSREAANPVDVVTTALPPSSVTGDAMLGASVEGVYAFWMTLQTHSSVSARATLIPHPHGCPHRRGAWSDVAGDQL